MRFTTMRDFDRLFDQMGALGPRSGVMPMDVFRSGDDFVMKFDLPGVHPENIAIEIEDGTLTIEAERAHDNVSEEAVWLSRERPQGKHSRSIKLGRSLDAENVEAGYDQGVLTVTIPIKAEAKPRKISVDVGTIDRVLETSAS